MTKRALGIRLQIVLAMGGLLVLAFVPMFVAVASLTRATVRSVRESSARTLGRSVAMRVEKARGTRGPDELSRLLEQELSSGAIAALAAYDRQGVIASAGASDLRRLLESEALPRQEHARSLNTGLGPGILVQTPGESGGVASIVLATDDTNNGESLLRLLGLYIGLFGLALLTFAYIALTRLIVRPLDALSAAARRVAAGARGLDVPETGPAEMADLATSVTEMTSKLRADEQRMRDQIDELERRAQKIREAQDRLVRSERLASVGRLSAGLAHEIGNPIAALLGLEDLLLEGGLSPGEQHDFLTRIRKETERIHLILRNLLDFARPARAPKFGVPEEPGSVAEAVRDVLALVQPQKSFRDVALRIETEENLPAVSLGHERIMQVLLNLLLNAADATGPRGEVTLTSEKNGNGVRIVVSDNGPGIDESVRSELFEPFVTTKEVGKGTGLGLAVCRGLVESAQGSIQLDETYRGGARFVIELPAAGE